MEHLPKSEEGNIERSNAGRIGWTELCPTERTQVGSFGRLQVFPRKILSEEK